MRRSGILRYDERGNLHSLNPPKVFPALGRHRFENRKSRHWKLLRFSLRQPEYAEDNPLLFWPIHCAQLLIRVQKPTFEATLTRSSPLRSPSLTKCGRSPALAALFSPADEVPLEVMEFDFREAGSYHYRYTWGDVSSAAIQFACTVPTLAKLRIRAMRLAFFLESRSSRNFIAAEARLTFGVTSNKQASEAVLSVPMPIKIVCRESP